VINVGIPRLAFLSTIFTTINTCRDFLVDVLAGMHSLDFDFSKPFSQP